MYGNRGPNLYLPQETGSFKAGNQGVSGDVALFVGNNAGLAAHSIGRGPPPSADRRAHTPLPPSLPNHNMRVASMPLLLNEQGNIPLHHAVPDVAGMMAAMSLRQDQLDEENKLLKRDNNALHTRLASVELRSPPNEPATTDADSDLRFAAAARKKQAKKRGPRKDRGPVPEAPASAAQSRSGSYLGDKKAPKPIQDARTATQRARKVMDDLADEDLRPAELTSSQATWDYMIIEELARHSFSNFRPQWRKQNNPDFAAKVELQKQFNRRRQRLLKNDQKASVAKAFAHKFNIPLSFVTRILNKTHESDEESGPEAASGESFETWKCLIPNSFRISIVPCIGCGLIPSLPVSRIPPTSRRIPDVAPWDFGISVPWLETNRLLDENEETLHDWNTYGNPPGFDSIDFTVFSNDS
ncbi:hypothetical protein R3P38DRAFT_2758891 [Favolaschia claudopus]|uniref:Homeobox domain-containing protein n=1 Tax=Favolaschia claudopus TaxID=2862362 RepID=A0AAW0E2J8_9AGAR